MSLARILIPLFVQSDAFYKRCRIWILLSVSLVGCSTTPSSAPVNESAAMNRVGIETFTVEDEKRGRSLLTEIWYPARDLSVEKTEFYNSIFSGRAARHAPIALADQRYPLILMSHGSGGSRYDLAWLAEFYTRRGYIVACTTHVGNTYGDTDPVMAYQIWNRPQDMSRVLDHLLQESPWSDFIDRERIVALGHSMGGYTVLALAGARYDYQKARAHCASKQRDPTCDAAPRIDKSKIDYTGSSESYQDPRIKAVVAMAPPVAASIIEESAKQIQIPVMIIAGLKDKLVLPTVHADRWHRLIGHSSLKILSEADHYSFLGTCSFYAMGVFFRVCRHTGEGERSNLHRAIETWTYAFFQNALDLNRAPKEHATD